jgi:hypothetical protein
MSGQETINIDGKNYQIGSFSSEAQQAIYHLTAIQNKLNEFEASKQHYEMAYKGFAEVVGNNLPNPIEEANAIKTFQEADSAKAEELGD